jgi:hypothetical protein
MAEMNPINIARGSVPRLRVEQAEFDAWLDRKRTEAAAKQAKANAFKLSVRRQKAKCGHRIDLTESKGRPCA